MRITMLPPNRRSKLRFFRYLPSEVVIDILSRLPIRTIGICKCVCRSWRDLLRTRQFADFHLPKSAPGLVIGRATLSWGPNDLSLFEFNDVLGLQHHHLHYKPLARIESVEFTKYSVLEGSANGLLLLRKRDFLKGIIVVYVCNPITREYLELPCDSLVDSSYATHSYGFGMSRMTRQYKVVRVFDDWQHTSICLVYVLGTGIWRSIAPPAQFTYNECPTGGYLNGNLHWLVQDAKDSHCISCFDLETETFSTFSIPNRLRKRSVLNLVVLGDCLCVSDATHEDDVVIWLMKEYGDEKSWTKEFVVRLPGLELSCHESDDGFVEFGYVHPIKVFKDGDIVMAWQNQHMFYYSNNTFRSKGVDKVFTGNEYDDLSGMKAMLHIPSFFSLSSFGNERVTRF